ncbi:MAG: triose-phosphate isomerase, partial [Salinivirgaceae bacterium]
MHILCLLRRRHFSRTNCPHGLVSQNNFAQLKNTVFQLAPDKFGKIILAYEPVWAIG